MTTWQLLTAGWHWKPEVLLGCAGLIVAYLAMLRFRFSGTALLFVAGVLVLLLALVSPIDTLAHRYLFSAHMLQHLLLVLVVPPLLLLGIPARLWRQALRFSTIARIEGALSRPLVAWLLASGAMWVWHLPALYSAAIEHDGIHIVQHLCFLVTATIFWWPVVTPLVERRYAPATALLYLFATMVATTVLGIILTFASPGLYPAYLEPADTLGILPLLREGWGLSPAADQQLGGLLMWVPSNAVYLWALIATLVRWYSTAEEDAIPVLSK